MDRALVCPAARRLAHLALVAAIAAAPLACSDDDGDDDDDGGTGPSTQPPLQTTVTIASFAFAPRVDTVAVGGTVTWTNGDQAPHTATSSAVPELWDSGTLATGESFARQFPAAGSFSYLCTIHPSMTGTIVAR